MSVFLWLLVIVCLLFACATDCRTCRVYNVTWWISGAAAAVLLGRSGAWQLLPELGFFCLLQLKLFSRMYGKADCYAFCVCAAAGASEGFGCMEYLLHMALAFGILAAVQLGHRNLDRRGNLRQPVAFLPYITVAFLLQHGLVLF